MNNNKIAFFILALSLTHITSTATAAPSSQAFPCFRYSNQISPGVAEPGEYKVVHSYTVNCGRTLHNITLRTQQGSLQPVTVEQLQGGGWVTVARDAHDPSAKWGGGSFRVILDNRNGKTPIAYRGSFSVPL